MQPTLYVYRMLKEKQTLAEFAVTVAQHVWAESPLRKTQHYMMGSVPEEIKPRGHWLKAHRAAKRRLAELNRMTGTQIAIEGERLKAHWIANVKKSLSENATQLAKIHQVRRILSAWVPPTPDHAGLKACMENELIESLGDGMEWQREELRKLIDKPAIDFFADALTSAAREVEHYAREHAAEVEQCQKLTDWVKALRASLK